MESRMVDEETHLRLVNGIDDFLSRIRTSAESSISWTVRKSSGLSSRIS
jgi:hypothetical protein